MKHIIGVCLLSLFILSCGSTSTDDRNQNYEFQFVELKTQASGEPNLSKTSNGDLILSWIEYTEDRDHLMMAKWDSGKWTPPMEIASGNNWFVNWADFPSVVAFGEQDSYLAAHWLQKSAEGTFDYDVRIATSKDGGTTWSESFIPHRDGIPAEHGFVSLLPQPNNRMLAVWLDGRNTKTDQDTKHDSHHHGSGPMTLRSAEFDVDGHLDYETLLDARVCDCCQTEAVMTDLGPVIFYRDRSEQEIRDISVLTRQNGQWSKPQTIHDDQWLIAGCPVNGPAAASLHHQLAVAWFSMPNNDPQVKVSFSEDGGTSFQQPIRVDAGQPIGRVDICMTDKNKAIVSWIEETSDGGKIRLVEVLSTGEINYPYPDIAIDASRQSGFPVLELIQDALILAWTDVQENQVKTATLHASPKK